MTLDDLKNRPDFQGSLKDTQQKWVLEYCSNGRDKLAATKAAYPKCTTDQSVSAMADRNLRHPIISRLVNEYFGTAGELPTKEQMLHMLWGRICKNPEHKFFLEYMKLYGDWGNFSAKPVVPALPPVTPENFDPTEFE